MKRNEVERACDGSEWSLWLFAKRTSNHQKKIRIEQTNPNAMNVSLIDECNVMECNEGRLNEAGCRTQELP